MKRRTWKRLREQLPLWVIVLAVVILLLDSRTRSWAFLVILPVSIVFTIVVDPVGDE